MIAVALRGVILIPKSRFLGTGHILNIYFAFP